MQLKKRIDEARLQLYDVMKYMIVRCKLDNLVALKQNLLNTPHTGLTHRYCASLNAMASIDVLLEKFEGIQPISFKKLPYEFQKRLVELLPPSDVTAFKLAGRTAMNYGNRRSGMFCDSSITVKNNLHFEQTKTAFGKRQMFTFSSVRSFLRSEVYFVQSILCLTLTSTKEFGRAIKIVDGNYSYLELQGRFTWKQAIHLMNVSKKMRYVCLRYRMQLKIEDFDAFFKAVVKWMHQQKDFIMMDVRCSHLDATFTPRFKNYIESKTIFHLYLQHNYVVICNLPKL
uniref:F-box domain-containing protein n=1 Tax=Panagrellus redivivus TaxID=6233 RepID=A0A7E4VCF9_PANRE